MARRMRGLREFYRVQVRLWTVYGQRHELSGTEVRALMALRSGPAPLRWAGDRLEGSVLPGPGDPQP